MGVLPPFLLNYLSENGHLEQVYKVLDNPSDVVLGLMTVMNETETMPQVPVVCKSETMSNMYRREGNQFYKEKHFRSALESYNKSLCYAPINSTAMKLAYGNRSALLYTVKKYSECINDIDTIFSMGCTDIDLAQRLRHRKIECEKVAWKSELAKNLIKNAFTENLFNFDVKRHPDIPCASTDINVIMESGLPKVVAARDIEVGTLVALEEPFACELSSLNYWIACHHCHKYTLNLLPCDGCCATLFCSETCKRKCYNEFHNIECQIMNFLQNDICYNGKFRSRMVIKAALKIKQKCTTWKELITASFSIGKDRMRNSCLRDIYDEKSKFSILSFDNNLHFVHAKTINHGVLCASILHHLKKIPHFWPCDEEKELAVRALARIMMNLYLFYPKIPIINTRWDALSDGVITLECFDYGWFAFASKLKHSCDANLLALGLKNNIALITLHPIQKGSELNVSYLGHYYEIEAVNTMYRHRELLHYGVLPAPSCRVCVEQWNIHNYTNQKLTAEEMRLYKNWISKTQNTRIIVDKDAFETTCIALGKLRNIAGTREYEHIYKMFRQCLSLCQYAATGNIYLSSKLG